MLTLTLVETLLDGGGASGAGAGAAGAAIAIACGAQQHCFCFLPQPPWTSLRAEMSIDSNVGEGLVVLGMPVTFAADMPRAPPWFLPRLRPGVPAGSHPADDSSGDRGIRCGGPLSLMQLMR